MLLALFCRIILLGHEPSDDLNRYLWEGRILREGFSPYQYAPLSPKLAFLAKNDPFHPFINHPDLPAIYPPLVLYFFSIITFFSYSPLSMKIVFILFDLGSLFFIISALKKRHLDLRWSVLYAFNPVILYSFAGEGHFDSIQIFFLLGALHLYDRRYWKGMFLFLALSVQAKYVAIIALPFFLNRNNAKYLFIAIAVIVVPYIVFVFDSGWQVFYSLIKFKDQFAFNGSVHGLLRFFFGSISKATYLCKALFLFVLLFGYIYLHPEWNKRFAGDPVSGSFFAFGALLLLSPTVHFWYISWIIPFVALRPAASWILLSLTIGVYFTVHGYSQYSGGWHLSGWLQVMEWLPVWMLLMRDFYLARHRAHTPIYGDPHSVSVVIPTQNESKKIACCIKHILNDGAVSEVIVVDGGSSDETVSLALGAGAFVMEHAGGRGGQVHAGIQKARGDVVAIVHADVFVMEPVFSLMVEVLKSQPTIAGGAAGGAFDGFGWRLRVLDFVNLFRVVATGISFGDQVQFFRRRPVLEKDLFPNIPLMEDVEFSLRLQKLGHVNLLFGKVLISPRKWKRAGYSRIIPVIRLVISYLFQRLWKAPDTQAMYNRYYK